MSDEREHLMRDATGLPERLEVCAGVDSWWVVGRRANGAVSLFAGPEFVLQFNPSNELRRAFKDGMRIKCEQRKLWRSERISDRGSMQLSSVPFTVDEQSQFLAEADATLSKLSDGLADSDRLGRIVSSDASSFLEAMRQWSSDMERSAIILAERPNAGA